MTEREKRIAEIDQSGRQACAVFIWMILILVGSLLVTSKGALVIVIAGVALVHLFVAVVCASESAKLEDYHDAT